MPAVVEDRERVSDAADIVEHVFGDHAVLLCGGRALGVRLGNGRTVIALASDRDDAAYRHGRSEVCAALGPGGIEALVDPGRFEAFVSGLREG